MGWTLHLTSKTPLMRTVPMAKRGKPRRSKPGKSFQSPEPTSTGLSRRNMLKRIRNGTLGIAALGATGWYVSSEVMADIREADLGRIGNGTPTVVQIHDPGCPTCRRLQRQARAALANFDDTELQYVVANIRQQKGKQLASKHGVQHVTLLLFDADGKRREIIRGVHSAATLQARFGELLAVQ